ncbi:TPA: type 4 pilus major pilin [Escherichia coli]
MNFRARIFYYFSLKKEKEEDKGLTLLEIAGALIIIGIVVALAMSQMSSTMASSDNQRELKNLQTIATTSNKYGYIITSKAVPKENCVELINSLRSSSMFTKIKGQTPASVDPVTVCSAATNDITLETSS